MKIYSNVYNKYRKSKKTKIFYILKKKALSLSIVYSKCGHYQKTLIMSEKNVSQEFRLQNIDKSRNYLTEETNQN